MVVIVWDTWTQLLLHSQLASTTRNNLPGMKHSPHWRGEGNLFVARQVAAEGITDAEGLGGRSSARRRGRFSSTRVTGLSSASLVQVAVGVILIISTAGAVSSHPPWTDSSPFQILSEWLDRSADSDLKGAGPPNIERAFKVSGHIKFMCFNFWGYWLNFELQHRGKAVVRCCRIGVPWFERLPGCFLLSRPRLLRHRHLDSPLPLVLCAFYWTLSGGGIFPASPQDHGRGSAQPLRLQPPSAHGHGLEPAGVQPGQQG